MIKFCSLYSGSHGNCIFLGTERTKILIDAGVNAKHIEQSLRAIGENPKEISAILITHEHADHTQGAGVFARRHKTPIYANQETWTSIAACIGPHFDHQHQITPDGPGTGFHIGDIEIQSIPISHDAAKPVAYTFFAENRQISVVTDTGIISQEIRTYVHGSDAVLLESNHDREMLTKGSYPWPLKQRIRGPLGHLNNDDAAEFALELARDGTKIIFLGHLSQHNNTPEIAFAATSEQLYTHGFGILSEPDIVSGPFIHLSVATQYKQSEVAIL